MSDKPNNEFFWYFVKTKDGHRIVVKEYYKLSRLVALREKAILEGYQCSKIQNPKK